MSVVIACPMCQQKVRAPSSVFGRQVKCPQCKNPFTAHDPEAVAVAATPTPGLPMTTGTRLTGDVAGLENQPAAPSAVGGERIWEEANGAAPATSTSGANTLVDYLLLRRMITPSVIVMVFYVGAAIIVGIGLFQCIVLVAATRSSDGARAPLSILGIGMTLVGMPVALLIWRIVCELLIAVFRILDNLREINEKMKTP